MTAMTFEEIAPLAIRDWDDVIRGYRSKHLFHESAWLRFLATSQRAKIGALRLRRQDGSVGGFFCFGRVHKGPFRLLGAPLQGWTTTFMGPVVSDLDTPAVLRVVEEYCRAQGIDYVEMASPALAPEAMEAAGYELDASSSFVVTIDDEAKMWSRLDGKACRYAIRKATKNGLKVERTTDPIFVAEYYTQLREVFGRQGLTPTYDRRRVETLWDALMTAGRLLALRVWAGSEVVATGLFPYDERVMYFWGGASRVAAYHLYPNELLQWHAMLFALEMGIPTYHMGGGGTFKEKFGGENVVIARWFKTRSAWAALGRAALKRYVSSRQRALGGLRRLVAPRPAGRGANR